MLKLFTVVVIVAIFRNHRSPRWSFRKRLQWGTVQQVNGDWAALSETAQSCE